MQQIPFFILIYLIGVFITKLLLGKAPQWFVQSAGFFVGLFNWVVTSLFVILIIGKFHFMPVLIINALELVFCIYLLVRTDIKWFNLTTVITLAIGVAIIVGVGLYFSSNNITNITPDSLFIIKMGVDYNKYGFEKFFWDTPASFGIFISVVQAASTGLHLDYLYLLQPFISINLIILIFFSLVETLGAWKWKYVLLSILATGFLYSSTMMRFEFSYIHTNVISAVYIFISFIAFRFFQKTDNDRWFMITCAMLMAFNLSRTENVFLSLMMLFIVLSQGKNLSIFGKISLWIFLFMNIAWQLILLKIVLKYPESMLSAKLIIATVIIILGFGFYIYFLNFTKFKNWIARRFIWKFTLILTLALIFAFCINTQNIFTSIKSNLISALVTGGWDLAWPILVGLVLLTWPKNLHLDKDFSISSIALWLIGFYVFILSINIFRAPYHTGWNDSANRIYTEMQPIIILLIIYLLKYKTDEGSLCSMQYNQIMSSNENEK